MKQVSRGTVYSVFPFIRKIRFFRGTFGNWSFGGYTYHYPSNDDIHWLSSHWRMISIFSMPLHPFNNGQWHLYIPLDCRIHRYLTEALKINIDDILNFTVLVNIAKHALHEMGWAHQSHSWAPPVGIGCSNGAPAVHATKIYTNQSRCWVYVL